MPYNDPSTGTSDTLVPVSFCASRDSSRNATRCAFSQFERFGRRATRSVAATVVLLVGVGCAAKRAPTTAPAVDPHYREALRVSVVPPAGWEEKPPKVTNNSTMQLWVSPSATTALGVIRFKLPLPVGHDLALWGFLQHMKKSEGRADLIEKQWDDAARVLRFVAEGGRYRVRTNLTVKGTDGWAIFAGTRTESEDDEAELQEAIRARDAVRVRH